MRLNFKTKYPFHLTRDTDFVQKILDGRKKTTLREDAKRRWKIGRKVEMATGSRFKSTVFNTIEQLPCVQDCTLEVIYNCGKQPCWIFKITVDNYELNDTEIEDFIRNEGFDNKADFVSWFFNEESKRTLRLLCWDLEHIEKTKYLLPF